MDVDLIFKIAAIGIIVAVLNQVLIRSGREEQAMMTTLAGPTRRGSTSMDTVSVSGNSSRKGNRKTPLPLPTSSRLSGWTACRKPRTFLTRGSSLWPRLNGFSFGSSSSVELCPIRPALPLR